MIIETKYDIDDFVFVDNAKEPPIWMLVKSIETFSYINVFDEIISAVVYKGIRENGRHFEAYDFDCYKNREEYERTKELD